MIKLNEAGMRDRIIFFVLGALLATIAYVAGNMNNFSSAEDYDFSDLKVFKNVHIEHSLSVGDYLTIGYDLPDSAEQSSDSEEQILEKLMSGELSVEEYTDYTIEKIEKQVEDTKEEIDEILFGNSHSERSRKPSIVLSTLGGMGSSIFLNSGNTDTEKDNSILIETSQIGADEFQYPFIKVSNPPFTKTISVK